MTDRELLELVLTKVTSMDDRLTSVEQNMATKEDITRLENKIDAVAVAGQQDVMGMLKHIEKKTDGIERVEFKLDVLNRRIFEQEADINMLKEAQRKEELMLLKRYSSIIK
jgi:hypothetical protein